MPGPHPRSLLLIPALLAVRCDPSVQKDPPPVGPGDSPPVDTAPPAPPLDTVQAALHPTIESIVVLDWEQREAATVWVEYGTEAGDTWQSPAWEREPGPQQELLLGIPYGTEVDYRLLATQDGETWQSERATITTGAVPDGVPGVTLLAERPEAQDPDTRFLLASLEEQNTFGLAVASWTFVFDRQGRVVWALESPAGRATIHARVSLDGADLLIDHNSFYGSFDGGAASQVARTKIDGSVVALYDTPGMHHPFTDMPDGSIVYLATAETYDSLVRLDPSTGERSTLWACQPFQEQLGVDQYCTSNAVSWHAPSQRFLVSFYSSDSVVEIDPVAGEATRWFGQLPKAWTFSEPDTAFWWQHGAHFTAEGTLLLSTRSAEEGSETIAREYALDQEHETLDQIWTFGEGEGIFAQVMGEAWRLGNGNTLHNIGSATRVREITPDGEVVWDIAFSEGTYLGRTTPLADLYPLAP